MVKVERIMRKMGFHIFLLLVLAGCFFMPIEQAEADEMLIVTLQFRSALETEPLVRNMLSDQGKISVDQRTNSLLIMDKPEKLSAMKRFLEQYDKPLPLLQVRVRFKETGAAQSQSVKTRGSISGRNWRISTGQSNRDGAQIAIQDQEEHQAGGTEAFVNTVSGEWAYILVGTDVIYTQRWRDLSRQYAPVYQEVIIQSIETGFDVKPVLVGEHVLIDIVPRISHAVPGNGMGTTYLTKAAVHLRAALGQWIEVGGTDQSTNEVCKAILSRTAEAGSSKITISLLVQKR